MARLGRAFPIRPHLIELGGNLNPPSHYYRTTFPLTENPMSQGGIWRQGLTNGLDWSNIRTTANKAFGTQDGNQGGGVFNDSVAALYGTWGVDQQAQGVVFNNVGAGGDYFAEVTLHLRCDITAHNIFTYEILFGLNPASGKHYVELGKWRGAINNPISLTGGNSPITALVTGDIVKATVIGNTITAYVNGTQVAQVTDSVGLSGTPPYTTGNPGIGHWLHNLTANGDPTQYGFSDYTAQTLDIRMYRQLVTLQSVKRAAIY